MALKATVPQPGQFSVSLPSEGTHPATCVALIDLGTQDRTYQGETKLQHMVFVGFEVHDDDSLEKAIIGRGYTFSLNEKAGLRGVVKALRGGRDVAPDEEVNFRAFLGRPCLVSIEHKDGKEGRKFANLSDVLAPPKGVKVPPPTRTPVFWEIDSGEPFPDEEWLPYLWGKKLLAWVEASKEWAGAGAGQQEPPF